MNELRQMRKLSDVEGLVLKHGSSTKISKQFHVINKVEMGSFIIFSSNNYPAAVKMASKLERERGYKFEVVEK